MTAELAVKVAAVLFAGVVVAVPYWSQIATLLSKAWTDHRRDIARFGLAAAILAVGLGWVPIHIPSIPWRVALEYMRGAAGIGLIAWAVASVILPAVGCKPTCAAKDVVAGLLLLTSVSLPAFSVGIPSKATAVVYVYEKDETAVPPAVAAGIDRINREQKIPATLLEVDTTDGTGQVPDQYKPAIQAATKLPSLVVLCGESVVRVVQSPKTTEEVVQATR